MEYCVIRLCSCGCWKLSGLIESNQSEACKFISLVRKTGWERRSEVF